MHFGLLVVEELGLDEPPQAPFDAELPLRVADHAHEIDHAAIDVELVGDGLPVALLCEEPEVAGRERKADADEDERRRGEDERGLADLALRPDEEQAELSEVFPEEFPDEESDETSED